MEIKLNSKQEAEPVAWLVHDYHRDSWSSIRPEDVESARSGGLTVLPLYDQPAPAPAVPVEVEPVAPPCWWIDHGSHGQITQREDEASAARSDGKRVVAYVQPAPRVKALEDAAKALIASANGSFEADDGERAYLVHSDQMEALRSALSGEAQR